MNYKEQLDSYELELVSIRKEKNEAVKNSKYYVAAIIRDKEKQKEDAITTLLAQQKKYLDDADITKKNIDEFKEISKILYFYSDLNNPIFKKKLKDSIRYLKVQKEESLLIQNYELRKEFTQQIQFLKDSLKDE